MTADRATSRGETTRRSLITIVLIVLLLGGGIVTAEALSHLRKLPELKEPEVRRYNVDVFVVEPVRLQRVVTGFGTAQADREVVLSAQVAGEVLSTHPKLEVGEQVTPPVGTPAPAGGKSPGPDEILLQIDPRNYEERVVQIENRMRESEVELERLKQEEQNLKALRERLQSDFDDFTKDFRKTEDLHKRGVVTESEFRQATIQLRTYEKVLLQNDNELNLFPVRRDQIVQRREALQNDLKLAKLDLERTAVTAPFTGRLRKVNVEQGQYVKPGDALVTVTDASIVEVPVALTLTDHARIMVALKSGQSPTVALAPNETAKPLWFGELVRSAPNADEQTRTVMVYVRVDNSQQTTPLLPGTFVQVRIDGPIYDDALVVPRDALVRGKLFVLKDGQSFGRLVTPVETLQSLAILDEGVAAGDQVILTNLDVLHDGARVQPQTEYRLPAEMERQRVRTARLLEAK